MTIEYFLLGGLIVYGLIATLGWLGYAKESKEQEKRSDGLVEENYQLRATISLYERDECQNAHIEEDCPRCGAK